MSYLETLYGMAEDPIRVPLYQQQQQFFWVFGQLVQHLGFSLCFPKVALVSPLGNKVRSRGVAPVVKKNVVHKEAP